MKRQKPICDAPQRKKKRAARKRRKRRSKEEEAHLITREATSIADTRRSRTTPTLTLTLAGPHSHSHVHHIFLFIEPSSLCTSHILPRTHAHSHLHTFTPSHYSFFASGLPREPGGNVAAALASPPWKSLRQIRVTHGSWVGRHS